MNTGELKKHFRKVFGENDSPIKFVRAPGRINLIGEHTDYNNGFVLPVAIDRFIFIAGRGRDDEKIIIYSKDKNEKAESKLGEISPNKNWTDYLLGVYYFLLKEGNNSLRGAEIFFTGDIPIGKGLSSSAWRQNIFSLLSSSWNCLTVSVRPDTTQRDGAFIAAIARSLLSRFSTSSAGSLTESMDPPGRLCIKRPRVATRNRASSRENTPVALPEESAFGAYGCSAR